MKKRNKLGQIKKGHKFLLGKKRPNISRKNNYNWKGGVIIQEGYKYTLKPNHPRAKLKKGYVAEHILVIEKHLKRFLKPEEVIHHIDENRLNNKIKNLRLFKDKSEHNRFHSKLRKKLKCKKK